MLTSELTNLRNLMTGEEYEKDRILRQLEAMTLKFISETGTGPYAGIVTVHTFDFKTHLLIHSLGSSFMFAGDITFNERNSKPLTDALEAIQENLIKE